MAEAPMTSGGISGTGLSRRRSSGGLPLLGLIVTIAIHAGVFGAMWLARAHASTDKAPILGNFVDAQLVKFGKPRDMTFLPHKEGVVKNTVQKADIKIARDMNAPHQREEGREDRGRSAEEDPRQAVQGPARRRSPGGRRGDAAARHRLARGDGVGGQGRSLHPRSSSTDRHGLDGADHPADVS